MKYLNLNREIILNKDFDIDIKGYNAKQVDIFLDTINDDYLIMEELISNYERKIAELETENIEIRAELENLVKNQVVSNEMVQTEQINTIDILKRLSKLEQEVYNQK